MNEEELFCKLFPDYAVNGKPLSPYFDCFESGYEQAENHISELEKENAELKLKLEALEGQTPWKDIKDKSEVIEQLTKAKELLKWFVWYFREDYNNVPYKHKVEEAEQFLSEVEK